MTTSEMFNLFHQEISLSGEQRQEISVSYCNITSALNRGFRNNSSEKTANSLQVGSYGRNTAISGISDLDMVYKMPMSSWDLYNVDGGQSKLLTAVRNALADRYPRTDVRADRQIVSVPLNKMHFEILPIFEMTPGEFKYPDTYYGGRWKITKPQLEIDAFTDLDSKHNSNVRKLCRIIRAWKNNIGFNLKGLLIDALVYEFFECTDKYCTVSFGDFDVLIQDFYFFIANQPERSYCLSPGSNQRIDIDVNYQRHAKKAGSSEEFVGGFP